MTQQDLSGQGLVKNCFMELAIDVAAPVVVGDVAGNTRRCIPLQGGSVAGEYQGVVLPGGADWQLVRPDGTLEIHARYTLEVEQGLIEVHSDGLRAGSPEVLQRLAAGEAVGAEEYYFRTAMRFYTASKQLDRLNRLLAIGVGERLPQQVRLAVHEVL